MAIFPRSRRPDSDFMPLKPSKAELAANDRALRAANPLPLELLIEDKQREVASAAAKLSRLRKELRELKSPHPFGGFAHYGCKCAGCK
jgi:hypothetical protein